MVNYIAILCTKISLYVIVYDKYGHCIEMMLIYRNVVYKESLYAIVYAIYGYCYKCYLHATFQHISSISMQCPYLSYTITYRLIFILKIATSPIQLTIPDIFQLHFAPLYMLTINTLYMGFHTSNIGITYKFLYKLFPYSEIPAVWVHRPMSHQEFQI